MTVTYHKPVLLHQAVAGLVLKPKGIYVDATFGGGGHSKAILEKMDATAKLFGFDHDSEAAKNSLEDQRFTFLGSNFKNIKAYLQYNKIKIVDGILADLGVSSYHFDTGHRGFSTRIDGALDMRMNLDQPLNAKTIVNEYSKEELERIFKEYGEIDRAKKFATDIINARQRNAIETTFQLRGLLVKKIPKRYENKILAQCFQAIRIEVNGELEALKSLLKQASSLLAQGGRLVCISYHSLEDRLVKRFINYGNFQGVVEKDFYGNTLAPMKKIGKLIVPDKNEIDNNSRARSAKMRIAEKK